MSSLIRGAAVLDYRTAGADTAAPRIFGTRVLRSDNVGIERPIPLAAPVAPALPLDLDVDDVMASPPPPNLAEIEEAARIQGFNVGFEQGHAAATAAVEEGTAVSLQRLSALIASVHENHAAFFRAAERQVVDLAIQIAQKVIEREVENMPDLAVGVIRAALEEMDARTAIRIRVNPDDVELLRRRWTQVVPTGVPADRIELQADERVQTGGGIIETTHGQVDAQLESKLAQLGNALWTFVMDVNASQEQTEVIDA